ncbi:MAG: hypothetical protein A2W90_10385 [Bacteroidetes bacterium GWF2_42_66]|nr:MAG: hypothetical protein A2W92_24080 [Bacteroidetes bacterium GWA2_42_15]OFY01502.1 MAG: hypothetical protein A2W89_02130 [Bacteroidetes bacterium GWE2_42_39]OFY43317.1 MAG: hypothetical protein A2W90_10385 [Bacteroidetes bacterium GWF2_42_66]HBL77500.1 hypothetical protein [Prolixibacteraceae bacterium]HCR89372.1 hypothetical protein [Prolixibacteraceae bacterium]
MKAKVLILVVFMGLTTVLAAQPKENGQKKSFRGTEREIRTENRLNLTDAQKEVFKQSMLEVQKQLQPIRNELGEAEAHQKTLTTAEKPDMAAINKNIEKIGALKVEMAKIQAKHRIEMRSQLTEEQRLKMDLMKGKMMHNRAPMGKRHNMRTQG